MTIATRTDLEIRYGAEELATTAGLGLDDPALDGAVRRALEGADAEITAALARRYRVPLATPVPDLVRRIAVDLAMDALPRDDGGASDLIRDRAKTARGLLTRLADGTLVLPGQAVADSGSGVSAPAIEAPPRAFTRDNLRAY